MSQNEQEKATIVTPLHELFVNTKPDHFFNYILVLIRPKGVSDLPDPFWVAYQAILNQKEFIVTEDLFLECLSLIFNLMENGAGRDYHPFPFFGKLAIKDVLASLISLLEANKKQKLADQIRDLFSVVSIDTSAQVDMYTSPKAKVFIKELMILYFNARLEFKKDISRQLYKMPRFEVLEILKDDTYGLYGFNIYFSNGSVANYERTGEKTTGLNVMTNYPISFHVGMISDLKRAWMIKDKNLFEVGLSGRYNNWGEWKPLVYPGDHELFLKESLKMSENDDQIAGLLFYIMCTGHRIIEFVAKTPIEMPHKNFSLGTKMHLYKCDQSKESTHNSNDFVIYDGHYELGELTPLAIRSAIASINVGLNRIAFAYSSSIDWCLKYSIVQHSTPSKPTPTEEDLKVLNSMLVDFPSTDDAIVLDICIDWYHRGELAKRKNVFLAFLCYYIALESVAIAVAEGGADLGINYKKETKAEREVRVLEGVQNLYNELYKNDPKEFIKRAYFEQIVPLKQRTRQVVESVFGKDHEYVKCLFEKKDDKVSLSDLRGELAHGGVTLLNPKHQNQIRERLPELGKIVTEFVKKIIIKPDQEFPEWSGSHTFSIFPNDPRDTMIASTDKIFINPNSDWKIKSEWLE